MLFEQLRSCIIASEYSHTLNNAVPCTLCLRYHSLVEEMFEKIDDWSVRLARTIKDLDDIREAMTVLKEIVDKEIEIDMSLGPVEESYTLLQRMSISVPQEEVDRVDTLRYAWQKVQTQATEMQDHLLKVQDTFRGHLLSNVATYVKDTDCFVTDYNEVSTGAVHAYSHSGDMYAFSSLHCLTWV